VPNHSIRQSARTRNFASENLCTHVVFASNHHAANHVMYGDCTPLSLCTLLHNAPAEPANKSTHMEFMNRRLSPPAHQDNWSVSIQKSSQTPSKGKMQNSPHISPLSPSRTRLAVRIIRRTRGRSFTGTRRRWLRQTQTLHTSTIFVMVGLCGREGLPRVLGSIR